MKVKKSFISEGMDSDTMALVAMGVVYFAAFIWGNLTYPKVSRITGKKLPNKNVFQALNSLFTEKSFIKDFQKILYQEGNFDEFQKKVNLQMKKNPKTGKDFDALEIWNQTDIADFDKNNVAKRVIQKLLNTSDYKKVEKEYNFTKEDKMDSAKLFYWLISTNKLNRVAKDIVFTNSPKSKILQKIGLNFPNVFWPRDIAGQDDTGYA